LGKKPNNGAGNVRTPINVTLRRVRVTIFAATKQDVLHILSVCSLSYSTCKVHAPCILSYVAGLSGFTLFFHVSHQQHVLREKKYWTQSVCFYFLYILSLKYFLFYKKSSELS